MVKYTHGHHPSVLAAHAWRTIANSAAYLEPHLTPGASLVDTENIDTSFPGFERLLKKTSKD